MLLISEQDIKESVTMEEAIDAIQNTYFKYAKNDFTMPNRSFIPVQDENYYWLMPCFVDDCLGVKVGTTFPSNRGTNNPVTQAVMFLNDQHSGNPVALINGTTLTTIKTGAVSGVTMRHFKKNAQTVGLIGTGLQGLYQMLAAQAATEVETIYLYDRSPENIERFIENFKSLSTQEVEFIAASDNSELVKNSDIIITTTTSVNPVLPDDSSLYNNKLIIAVGSYRSDMRELPQSLFENLNYYYIDSEQGKQETGDIIDPIKEGWIDEERVILFSDVLTGQFETPKDEKPIVFKTVSMALFDTDFGNFIYKKAKESGKGQNFEL